MGVHPHIGRALACAASLAVMAALAPAMAGDLRSEAKTPEDRAVGAFLSYCLPVVTGGNDIAPIAQKRKLHQVPAAESDAYLQGKPGTVFELPEVGRGAVLAVAIPACSVMLERVDAREFLEQATYWFGADHSPFRLTANKTLVNGDIQREYRADIDGKAVALRLFLRLQPIPGGAQAMLTGGRAE
jgi:hypothetical protein